MCSLDRECALLLEKKGHTQTRNSKPEAVAPAFNTRNPKPYNLNHITKPYTLNSKPEDVAPAFNARNPKPSNLNLEPKPETFKPKL